MFDGEYYIQVQKEIDKYKYQFGKGCLSDQLLGQFLAYMAGIGEILPKEHVKSAMESVFKYNYKTDFIIRTVYTEHMQSMKSMEW